MERTHPDQGPEAPRPRRPSVEAQVRTMLGEIADRLERSRSEQTLTDTGRIAVIQATTMDPVLSRALRAAAPPVTEPITRGAYAARLRQIVSGAQPQPPAHVTGFAMGVLLLVADVLDVRHAVPQPGAAPVLMRDGLLDQVVQEVLEGLFPLVASFSLPEAVEQAVRAALPPAGGTVEQYVARLRRVVENGIR